MKILRIWKKFAKLEEMLNDLVPDLHQNEMDSMGKDCNLS